MATFEQKALTQQLLRQQLSAQMMGNDPCNQAHTHTVGYVQTNTGAGIPTTGVFTNALFPHGYPSVSIGTTSVDPNAAKIAALEEKVAKLEAHAKMVNDDLDEWIMRVKVLEELVEKLKPTQPAPQSDKSAGAVLGRAISKHW